MSCVHKFGLKLQSVSSRIEHIETKMGELATTINNLIAAHDTKEDEMKKINAKIDDIEDRSRRNNLKIRGVPELIKQSDLRKYVTHLFTSILPELTELDIMVDRIHHLPKPP